MTLGGHFGALFRVLHWELGSIGEMEEYSASNKLLLDFDRKRTPRLMETFSLLRMCGLHATSIRDDRTRKGWHRTILLRETLPEFALVAIQSNLGSDRRREGLNIMRLVRTRNRLSPFQRRRWNILYSAKL